MKAHFAIASVLVTTLFTGPAYAQAMKDPIVEMRADLRAAHETYAQKLIDARKERNAKVDAAVEAAVKDATAKGKDPLVAKRDAEAKAEKAAKAEYDAKISAATKEWKATRAAAEKKGAPAKKS